MNEDQDIPEQSDAEFEQLFFNGEPVSEEPEKEVVEDNPEDSQEEPEEVEDLATEDEEDETPEEEIPPVKKKNRAQERIDELTAKARTEERERMRERAEFEKRIAELEAKYEKKEEPKALREQLPADAPHPDMKGEDGELVYALGEFDPQYIADLTRWTIKQETQAAKAEAEQEARARAIEQVQNELAVHWAEKLDAFEETVPDVRENITTLTDTFQGLDTNYGEYLATTIMASDYGPEMMNYLALNLGEAQKIVASGPAAATLALGRLEARFIKSEEQEKKPSDSKKVSAAKEPPEDLNRGSHGRFSVKPDTDDQAAFEREFFKKN